MVKTNVLSFFNFLPGAGYGNSGPNNCAAASLIIVIQSIFGVLLDAMTIGVLFARISHPYQRAHSIFLSETAVVLRRDGILKFCFRCADVKATQVWTLYLPLLNDASAVPP